MKPTDNRTGTAVTVEHLCRRFGEQHALRDVSLALDRPRATSILNVLPARIETARPVGDHGMLVVLRLGEEALPLYDAYLRELATP